MQRAEIHAELFAVNAWAGRDGMFLNASENEHFHAGGSTTIPCVIVEQQFPIHWLARLKTCEPYLTPPKHKPSKSIRLSPRLEAHWP